jgi:hypothetical protein
MHTANKCEQILFALFASPPAMALAMAATTSAHPPIYDPLIATKWRKSVTILQTQPIPTTLSERLHWNASDVCWRDGATFCAETPLSLSLGIHPVFVLVAGAH